MAVPGPEDPEPAWLENGFPPRSFPVEAARAASTARHAGGQGSEPFRPRRGGRARRGRWAIGIALILTLLLVGLGLVLTNRRSDDPGDLVAAGTSTTEAATSVPTFDTSTVATTSPSTTPAVGTTQATDPTTSTTAGAGVLEASLSALTIAKVDAAAGPQTGRLTLRNSGPSPLSFTTQTSAAGLSASPARATIAPGSATDLVVSLEGSRVPAEGPFTGTITIGGTGGSKTVQVTSVVGRAPVITEDAGESCATTAIPCSRQIKVVATATPSPSASPCTTSWSYAVTVTDQSQIQGVKALARKGLANADAPLLKGGQPTGTTGVFQSTPMPPVPGGLTLRFVIEATDQYGFTTRLAEQSISC